MYEEWTEGKPLFSHMIFWYLASHPLFTRGKKMANRGFKCSKMTTFLASTNPSLLCHIRLLRVSSQVKKS